MENTEEWTPYVTARLPWTPLVPSYGLEYYGLPIPRRNAETWRQFDVTGLIEQDYSGTPEGIGMFHTIPCTFIFTSLIVTHELIDSCLL